MLNFRSGNLQIDNDDSKQEVTTNNILAASFFRSQAPVRTLTSSTAALLPELVFNVGHSALTALRVCEELLTKVQDSRVVQWRNRSVLRGRESIEPGLARTRADGMQMDAACAELPGLARMDNEVLAAALGNCSHKVPCELRRIKLVRTQT